MNQLSSFCSPALLERLAGTGSDHNNVVELAERRIAREIAKLPALDARILRWRYGVDCEQLADDEISDRLHMHIDDVRRIAEEALMHLGFSLLAVDAA